MAWKMIYLARRNPALAPEDFPQAWREHSALGAGCTNVRDKVKSVRQCSRDLENTPRLPGATADYDGVNLLVLNAIGDCHARLGQKEDALAAWKKSLEINPKQEEVQKRYAKLGGEAP